MEIPIQRILPVLLILAILGIIGSGFFFFQYQKAQRELTSIQTDSSNTTKAAQEEVKKLVTEVGKLLELPSEDPTVATITDIDKLKDQAFFAKGKNGDKVLIYTNARKAILYDPKIKKILDVAPVNIGTPSAQVIQPKFVIRNGTTANGLTAKAETDIKKVLPQAVVTVRENAVNKDYERTLLIGISESGKNNAEIMAKAINAQVSSLPAGESSPENVDFVLILGKDRT